MTPKYITGTYFVTKLSRFGLETSATEEGAEGSRSPPQELEGRVQSTLNFYEFVILDYAIESKEYIKQYQHNSKLKV